MNISNSIDEKKRNTVELLFFAFFIPWVAIVILSESTYNTIIPVQITQIGRLMLPLCLVFLKLFLFDKHKFTHLMLILSGLTLILVQGMLLTGKDDILLSTLLVIAAYKMDFKKILKAYLCVSSIMVVILTASAVAGIIPNIVNHQRGMTRYALGSIWCTDYAARIFFLLVILLYLYSAKMRFYHWIGVLAVAVIVYKCTYGRLDFTCMVLAIVLFFLHEQIEKKENENKLKSFWISLWEKLAPVLAPAAAVIMTLLTVLYSPDNKLLSKLNDLLSTRLQLGKSAFTDIGVTVLGQEVKWIGMGYVVDDSTPEGYNFVDCSYLNILFASGLIVAIALIVLLSYMAYRNRKDTRFVLVIALISLNCMISHHLIEVAYNPIWVALLAVMPIVSENKKDDPSSLQCPDHG